MTAQSILLEFVRAVDPYGRTTGVEITASNIHSQDGERWTAQQRLDIYNQARFVLLQAMLTSLNPFEARRMAGTTIQNKTDWSWTLSGSVSSAAKPAGYVEFISASTVAGVQMVRLDPSLIEVVLSGSNPNYVQSATNIHIFELGTNFVHFGMVVPTASTYQLRYIGLTRFTLENVTTGTTVGETFNDNFYPVLVSLAIEISKGLNPTEQLILAQKLLMGGR